jgi:hypothetical protein
MRRLPSELAVVKLDLDRKRVPWSRILRRLSRAGYTFVRSRQRQSRSGGWHVWIWVRPLPRTPMEVIALQVILGSDPEREAMNLVRARKLWRTPAFARTWWNVLYRPAKLSQFPISNFR